MPINDLSVLNTASVVIGAALAMMMLVATVVSLLENEQRAARRAFVLFVLLPLPYLAAGLLEFPYHTHVSAVLVVFTLVVILILFVPAGRRRHAGKDDRPRTKHDERDVMFSRMRLEPGTERFEAYYRDNPDKKGPDDLFRSKAGLLSKNARNYEPLSFAAADANFEAVKSLHPLVEGVVTAERTPTEPQKITRFLKNWGRRLGAVSIGVTEVKNYHLYSVIGRGDDYGKPVDLAHKYAIAFTVEMEKDMVDSAPFGPTVMESAQQYLHSGTIAVQIAEFLRNLGYPARAHIDGNYRVVCPLVARDAGLGEIGRMGLLMTPMLGPRVRIAVVTTDLPLVCDQRRRDFTKIDFCSMCNKCADVCPSRAIPVGGRAEIEGVKRWRIDSEACFTYWCVVGTDCARCVKACPYSHPDNFLHYVVRAGVRNSPVFRRFALEMDDFFYGRKPAVSGFPDWMKVQ